MYLPRHIDNDLAAWRREALEKPLLVRGARQVGKSTAVRELAKQFDHFLEVNFEEYRTAHVLFEGDLDPNELCENLSAMFDVPIIPGKTLLFFDEVQACVPAISSLRFFYEKMPGLHVIAAGSLLEFALADIPSFGVGRIRSMFVYPLSFDEFLTAVGEETLLRAKQKASPAKPLAAPLHGKLLTWLKRFLILGGMPEVVSHYVRHKDLRGAGQILDDLAVSLRADFAKYRQRVPALRISEVFDAVVAQSGSKFVYAKAATEANHKQVKEAVDLLVMAGLAIPVTHTSANGLPLGAESNPKKRKMLLLDTGILQRLLGLDIASVLFDDDFDAINRGAIAEQHCGLELLKAASCYHQERLWYWHREALNSNAEVDYVIQKGRDIVPVEVKSGKRGSMQSLHLFLKEKDRPYGVRFSNEPYAAFDGIQVWPLYAVREFAGG